jgi:hypothetical protein
VKRRGIAAEFGYKGVGSFVAGCGEQENDVPDHAENDEFLVHANR